MYILCPGSKVFVQILMGKYSIKICGVININPYTSKQNVADDMRIFFFFFLLFFQRK